MPAVVITPEDLYPFADIPEAKAQAMIADAIAMAARVAPCIIEDDFTYSAAAKAIIRSAILRRNDSGSGAVSQVGAGSFQQSFDNRQPHRGLFWPSEIEDLQGLCSSTPRGRAYEVDTMPPGAGDGYWKTPDRWVPLP